MHDPFDLHPEDKKKMSNTKKSTLINVQKIREVMKRHLEKINSEKAPTWGYNVKHINLFFDDIIAEIAEIAEEKNDS